jgi:bisanhydrobacterioruberin hydratase
MSLPINKIRNIFIDRVRETRIFFIVFYSVGVFGIAAESTRNLFVSLTPLALLLGLACIIVFHQTDNLRKDTLTFLSIFITGFLIEAAGVYTGKIFGNYSYGTGLGIKVLNTPILIGINWVVLVYCTAVITEKPAMPALWKILIASSIMVFYDVIMEQVAPAMNMWSFKDGFAPAGNYIAWFVLAVIFHSFVKLAGVKIMNRQAPFIFYIQTVFFIILTIFFKLAQ